MRSVSARSTSPSSAQASAAEADGLPERYDVVSTFDVVHDAPDPIGLSRGIRRALDPDGTYLLLEMNCTDDAADNIGPLATLLYGISILYCTPASLARGGAGLGTCGCPPAQDPRTLRPSRLLQAETAPGRQPLQHPLRGHAVIPRRYLRTTPKRKV